MERMDKMEDAERKLELTRYLQAGTEFKPDEGKKSGRHFVRNG